jgi:3-deoxy-D-manno-octulosonate 8-phosphate phosphatase (KDO 8-P phosphatase)
MNILQQFKPIKLIVMDVDGVLTDGKILLLESLEMARNMHVKDGYAMQLAIKKGYQIVIISGATDGGAVSNRLKKLGIKEIHQGIKDKATLLSTIIKKGNFTKEQVLFIGDDIPDYQAMKLVGLACCPADAVSEIKFISNYISPINGGEGCVRDIIEKVLKLNGHWDLDTTVTSK